MTDGNIVIPEEFRKYLGEFISRYVVINDRFKEDFTMNSDRVIIEAVCLLINNCVFTERELTRELFRLYGIFIPTNMIKTWYRFGNGIWKNRERV